MQVVFDDKHVAAIVMATAFLSNRWCQLILMYQNTAFFHKTGFCGFVTPSVTRAWMWMTWGRMFIGKKILGSVVTLELCRESMKKQMFYSIITLLETVAKTMQSWYMDSRPHLWLEHKHYSALGGTVVRNNLFWLVTCVFALKNNCNYLNKEIAICHDNLIDVATILGFIEGFITFHRPQFCLILNKFSTNLWTKPNKMYCPSPPTEFSDTATKR